MTLEKQSHCKVNLLLNVLGKRADGYHELETVMVPIQVRDRLEFARRAAGTGIQLTCNEPALPTDRGNLVYRAAAAFLTAATITEGVSIHLEKNVPLAAGLGGGSGNAACTLLGLNELFGFPLEAAELRLLAAELGSDVPFFLQPNPALATGRGEQVEALARFAGLGGTAFVLVHPGFGISTAWAYRELARFPAALNGRRGRAKELVALLRAGALRSACAEFHNSLEAPALEKYPLLELFKEFFRENGALAALMSGSGSSTFALVRSQAEGENITEKLRSKFGTTYWTRVVEPGI